MQHQLDRVVGRVLGVAHGPVVPDGVGENGAVAIEIGCRDGTAG